MTDHWADLELRHLRSLRAIAETGSFHAAADALDYTQSAVSQHVAALEEIVGLRLVDRARGRRTVELTEAGALLLRHADAIVARLSAARADLQEYAGGASGALRVGMYQSVGAHILPTLLTRFSTAWPGVELQIGESYDDGALLARVESGELDLAFTMLPLPDGPFDHVELLRDPYVLLAAVDSPLARVSPAPPLADIAAGPLVGYSGYRGTQFVEGHLRRSGTEPRVVFRSDDNGTVQELVAAGIGAAVVPLLTCEPHDPRVVIRPMDMPPRLIALAWHRDRHRSPAARAFIDLAIEICAGFEEVDGTIGA